MAEADRAEKAEDLAPIINAMVGFLDAALSRYFYIAEEAAANPRASSVRLRAAERVAA